MSVIKDIFGIVCVLVVLATAVAVVIMVCRSAKKTGRRKQYDERQKLAQGKAYTAAYWTLFVSVIVGIPACRVFSDVCDPAIGAFLAIVLSATVFCVYCVATNAYFGIKENVTGILICFALCFIANLAFGLNELFNGRLVVDGALMPSIVNLAIAGMLALIFIAMIIRKITRGRDGEEDE